MNAPIIEVSNLSKLYRLGQINAGSLREEAERLFSRRKREAQAHSQDFWALKDVSFAVQPGEVLGIVGRNGAGKSTLLKLLSRITEPTSGEIRIRGRVASLLEVGTGFHPELTGRENIYLNGAILGMTHAEIKAKFDEIVDFAEVEAFLDTPVKRYSSGMYVRLAFAVAAHLEPEILIVDEVLAVGDVEFQKKCLGKMGEVARTGRTILFVSHNMQAVSNLCTRAMLIRSGQVAGVADPSAVVREYLRDSVPQQGDQQHVWTDPRQAPGNENVRLRQITIAPEGKSPGEGITTGDAVSIEVEFWNFKPVDRMAINLVLYRADGTEVLEDWSINDPDWTDRVFPTGLFRTRCVIPPNLLNSSEFKIDLIFIDAENVLQLQRFNNICYFMISSVEQRDIYWHGTFLGPVHIAMDWKTALVNADMIYPSIPEKGAPGNYDIAAK